MTEWGKDVWPSGFENNGWYDKAANVSQQPNLKAKEGCCEEASTQSRDFYIPCNNPAINMVGWKGRSDAPIRMCAMCTNHNVKNRGGEIISFIDLKPGSNPTPSTPWDGLTEDQLLLAWDDIKKAIETAKAQEMELRKYIVNRAFPKKEEGMNNKELGNGYVLKAGVKFNYNLADNDTVENCLARVAALGNQGPFIADRLVSWTPNFLLKEYRQLGEDAAKGEKFAQEVLKAIEPMLTISEAAPSLEIKQPKSKNK